MMNIFRFLYWTVTALLFISSTAFWIFLMIKRDVVTLGCQQYMALTSTSSITSTYSPVTLPDGTDGSLYNEYCTTATRQLLIISGVLVFLGNLVQVIKRERERKDNFIIQQQIILFQIDLQRKKIFFSLLLFSSILFQHKYVLDSYS